MIVLHFDEARWRRMYRDIERKIPWVMKGALDATAADVQAELRASLSRYFTIRSPWTAKGIRVKRAHTRDLTAVVGSFDEYMARQAEGGDKTPREGKEYVGVPVGARPDRTDVTPRSRWPGALKRRGRKNVFVASIKGAPALWQREGEGDDAQLHLMYLLRPEVRVEAEWPFYETAERVARLKWSQNAEKAMAKALRRGR